MMGTFVRTIEGGPPLAEVTVQLFEKRLGLTLPECYRSFLLATNGGRPVYDLFMINGLVDDPLGRIHVFFGLNDPIVSCNLDWNWDVFKDRIPPRLLPVATTDGSDKICLDVVGEQTGVVFFWDAYARPGEHNLYFLADSFDSFLASLHADELSPRHLHEQ
jgi:hypothetical protein